MSAEREIAVSVLRPDGREPCCPLDFGGSHYHCARCDCVTGMYGHYRGGEWLDGKFRKFAKPHMCCPGDCASPEAHR